MIVKSISYRSFRNIENAVIEPDSSINLLFGANAEGKTAALEGIYLFAYGRSFRAAKEKEMVRFGDKASALKLVFTDARRTNQLEIRADTTGRRIFIKNGVPLKVLSEFVGCFRAVLFCPQHLSIIKAGPSERRRFADSALTQLYPDYVRELQRYNRILAERNTLLKNFTEMNASFTGNIAVWSEQLSESAEKIAAKRAEYVCLLDRGCADVFAAMTGGREKPELVYTEPHTAQEYYRMLTSSLEREIRAKATLFGPHRDDIAVALNGREARLYASQGQQRSIALAMKLSEGEISRKVSGEYPVFLFDDVLSELDTSRRRFLLDELSGRQVIMTSCEDGGYSETGAKFRVAGGTYEKIKD